VSLGVIADTCLVAACLLSDAQLITLDMKLNEVAESNKVKFNGLGDGESGS
jgi:hypothetical protein